MIICGKLYKVEYEIHSLYYYYRFKSGTILMILKQDFFKKDTHFGIIYKTQILVEHKIFEIYHYDKYYIQSSSILIE